MSNSMKKSRKNKKGKKGGTIGNSNICNYKNAFLCFLDNCVVTTLSTRSNGGILLLCTNKDNETPLNTCSASNPISYTKTLVLKITFNSYSQNRPIIVNTKHNFEKTAEYNFLNEVTNQVTAHNNSLDTYLEPVVPSICFASTSNSLNNYILDILHKKGDTSTKTLLYNISITPPEKAYISGMMAMEFLDGFKPLNKFITFTENITYKSQQFTIPKFYGEIDNIAYDEERQLYYIYTAIYELYRLRMVGFNHGDFHTENIMLNDNYYFKGTKNPAYVDRPCRPMIIDAGRFKKTTPPGPNTSITDIIKGEMEVLGKSSDYWSYQWLKKVISDDNRINVLNKYFEEIKENREKKKSEFLELLNNNEFITPEQINQISQFKMFGEISDDIVGGGKKNKTGGKVSFNNSIMNPTYMNTKSLALIPTPNPNNVMLENQKAKPQISVIKNVKETSLDEIVKENMKNPTFAKNWDILGKFVASIKQSQIDILNNLEQEIKDNKLNPELKPLSCSAQANTTEKTNSKSLFGFFNGGKEKRQRKENRKTRKNRRKSI